MAVEQVFKIGSMEPGAMLYDASKEFEASDYKLQVDFTVRHTVSLFVEFLFDRSQFMVKITKFTEPRAKCVGVDGLNT